MNRNIIAGILAAASLGGGSVALDATTLNEVPIDKAIAIQAGIDTPTVTAKQVGNVVETTLPWKDQPGLTVKYDMGVPSAAEKVKDKRKEHAIVEPIENRSDGIDFDIILNEKPATTTFCYQIDGWENYDFYKQPALTQEEIDQGAERPDWIVDGYVVYHKTLRNHQEGGTNYETGKFGDMPYPMLWSVNATSTTKHRAEAFNITEGRTCVTVAQKDLDTMKYPIRVDPTFGYTTKGASIINWATDYFAANKGTPDSDGTVDSVTVATCGSGNRNFRAVIVLGSTKTIISNGVGNTAATENTCNTGGFTATATFSTPPSITSGISYYAGFITDFTSTLNKRYYDTGSVSGTSIVDNTNSYSSPTDPTDASNTTNLFSVYATYTASGGSSVAPTDSVIMFE